MKTNLENKLLAVIRVRGRIGVRREFNETLDRLHLGSVNNLSILAGTKSNIGMVNKVSDFITYGEISRDTLEKVLAKKGSAAPKDDADAVSGGKKSAKEVISLPIRLRPPRHGYEGIKHNFAHGGALGYRGEKINRLIERMV